jgi:hypothetical protein
MGPAEECEDQLEAVSRGERPFAVIKRVFGSGHVLVMTVGRVHVKMVFSCFCFNLLPKYRNGLARADLKYDP